MKTLARLAALAVIVLAALQFVRPSIPAKPATAELQAPAPIHSILEKDCYSCHSDERRLAWFDQIVPAYWLVRYDVLAGRRGLNFSTIGAKPAAAQKAALFEGVNMIQLGAMPLPRFLAVHPEAKVTPEELSALKAYLAPWATPPVAEAASTAETRAATNLSAIAPEWNGFPFPADFESWKPISTTDRGDNSTFRFVLGNDVAVKAAAAGNISPWPDGTRFAKIAWRQETGADGLFYPGQFLQVEFMLKDAERYKETDGWGWGRWLGFDLKPYGKDEHFVRECTGCHLPVSGNDYVYSLPMTTAKIARGEAVNNRAASLPAALPYQPLAWNAITMFVDPKLRTTSTLYGDEAAMRTAPQHSSTPPAYPEGAVLALVTWAQREDPHWFGARIPDLPVSIEFLQVGKPGEPASYRRFAGPELSEEKSPEAAIAERSAFILKLVPAQLP
ncbi:MAG TPA: cytochrome P460 family protein [Terriglobales bacterium]|nr:cytochrome P460 family protein [Terriglobales bacterium]